MAKSIIPIRSQQKIELNRLLLENLDTSDIIEILPEAYTEGFLDNKSYVSASKDFVNYDQLSTIAAEAKPITEMEEKISSPEPVLSFTVEKPGLSFEGPSFEGSTQPLTEESNTGFQFSAKSLQSLEPSIEDRLIVLSDDDSSPVIVSPEEELSLGDEILEEEPLEFGDPHMTLDVAITGEPQEGTPVGLSFGSTSDLEPASDEIAATSAFEQPISLTAEDILGKDFMEEFDTFEDFEDLSDAGGISLSEEDSPETQAEVEEDSPILDFQSPAALNISFDSPETPSSGDVTVGANFDIPSYKLLSTEELEGLTREYPIDFGSEEDPSIVSGESDSYLQDEEITNEEAIQEEVLQEEPREEETLEEDLQEETLEEETLQESFQDTTNPEPTINFALGRTAEVSSFSDLIKESVMSNEPPTASSEDTTLTEDYDLPLVLGEVKPIKETQLPKDLSFGKTFNMSEFKEQLNIGKGPVISDNLITGGSHSTVPQEYVNLALSNHGVSKKANEAKDAMSVLKMLERGGA